MMQYPHSPQMALKSPRRNTIGIGFFSAFLFMLFFAPRANIPLGPVPIYLMDILLGMSVFFASQTKGGAKLNGRFWPIVMTIFVFAMIGEAFSSYYSGTILQPIYMATRLALAFSVFFVVGKLFQTQSDINYALKAIALASVLTSTLMIATSLPITRNIVLPIFSIPFLEPATNVSERLEEIGDSGARGRTLVGVSILGATFINVAWPLCALLLTRVKSASFWWFVAAAACTLAPFGVLMSYSRGPILGTILLIAVAIVIAGRRLKSGLFRPILVALGLVMLVGTSSQLFFFDRLISRTTAVFDAPLDDERESERILAYSQPFQVLGLDSLYLVRGEGLSIDRTERARISERFGNVADHAMFAKAFYKQGFIAALSYLALMLVAMGTILSRQKRTMPGTQTILTAVSLSFVALIPWCLFGHAMVSTPRGAMMFYFVIGFIALMAQIRKSEQKIFKGKRYGTFRQPNGRHSSFG